MEEFYMTYEPFEKKKIRRLAVSSFFVLEVHFLFNIADHFINGQADLFHGITVTQGDGIVFLSIEIYRYTNWRANFILTAVTLADAASFIVIDHEVLSELGIYFRCIFR